MLHQLALVVALGQQRWRQVVVNLEVAFELFGHAFDETGLRVQAGDFVFVLVGHQAIELAGHDFAEGLLAQRCFGCANAFDKVAVLNGIGRVLVSRQALHPVGHQLIEALALDELHRLRGPHQRHHLVQVLRRMAAPFEGTLVVLDRDFVELDRAHQRFTAEWHPAFLPGVAENHRVDVDRVAHQLARQGVGVKGAHTGRAHLLHNGGHALLGRVLPIAVLHEGGRRCAVAVERHMGAALAHAQHSVLAGAHDRVAAKNQVGGGHAHAGGADVGLGVGDDHMAPGRAALLGQASRVLRDDTLAFDVRRHAQQLADGDNARAAHAGHHHAPGVGQVGLCGFGQFAQGGGRSGF